MKKSKTRQVYEVAYRAERLAKWFPAYMRHAMKRGLINSVVNITDDEQATVNARRSYLFRELSFTGLTGYQFYRREKLEFFFGATKSDIPF